VKSVAHVGPSSNEKRAERARRPCAALEILVEIPNATVLPFGFHACGMNSDNDTGRLDLMSDSYLSFAGEMIAFVVSSLLEFLMGL
jgi:hypothetical protein